MRRVLLLATVAICLLAPAASAKVPPSTIEVSTDAPIAGEPIRVEVRFWNDGEHTEPADWPDIERLRDYLWFYPEGDLDAAVAVDARLASPGIYEASVTPTGPGTWVLCPWDVECDEKLRKGYPGRMEVTVLPEAVQTAAPPTESGGVLPWVPLTAVIGVSAAILVGRRYLGRRSRA